MADTSTGSNPGAFLTQKVGPLPLWAWLAAAGGLWWYFQSTQSSASASGVPNQQTDPAGNVGTIDPATGYVYGTPEDLAALAANNAGVGGGSAGTNATTGAQTYADNNTWGIAAVNYLVGLGIDATTASEAIQSYLGSQALTTAQQADVNLAIQALGAPPSLPGPIGNNPPPVTTPPGGTTGTTPPAATPFTTNVPDGTGGWMAATFPSQAAYDAFLKAEGASITAGGGQNWPGGYTTAQITAAIQAAGGSVAGPPGQSGYGIDINAPTSFNPVT